MGNQDAKPRGTASATSPSTCKGSRQPGTTEVVRRRGPATAVRDDSVVPSARDARDSELMRQLSGGAKRHWVSSRSLRAIGVQRRRALAAPDGRRGNPPRCVPRGVAQGGRLHAGTRHIPVLAHANRALSSPQRTASPRPPAARGIGSRERADGESAGRRPRAA